MLDSSPLLKKIRTGQFPPTAPETKISDLSLNWHYYLTDGIYPRWRIFVQSYNDPSTAKEKFFSARQESVRKSVERVFGVLFQRFGILRAPSRLWRKEDMRYVISACVIIHNMIVEHRKHGYAYSTSWGGAISDQIPTELRRVSGANGRRAQVAHWRSIEQVEDSSQFFELRKSLVDHIWEMKGEELEA